MKLESISLRFFGLDEAKEKIKEAYDLAEALSSKIDEINALPIGIEVDSDRETKSRVHLTRTQADQDNAEYVSAVKAIEAFKTTLERDRQKLGKSHDASPSDSVVCESEHQLLEAHAHALFQEYNSTFEMCARKVVVLVEKEDDVVSEVSFWTA